MISQIMFRHIRSVRALTTAVLVSALVLIAVITFYPERPGHAANHKRQQLTFEDRVAAQRAIEEVYHQHRIWPADNPQPKPPLEAVLGEDALRAKVEDALRLSTALEVYWQRPVSAADLQAEVDRMARDTHQPDLLRELWAALGNDPLRVAECLARPLLVERLVRQRFEDCAVRNEGCEALGLTDSAIQHSAIRNSQFDEWWHGVRAQMEMAEAAGGEYRLPEIAAVAAPCGGDLWTATSTTGAPSARIDYTAVWTGSEMIVWGGRDSSNTIFNTGGRYNPATDTWASTNTTDAPSARYVHTAVWTGSEMIVWGGFNSGHFRTGGRYNPATNSWTATNTTGAPEERSNYAAVWTGNEMIVWGGNSGRAALDTGGRYNPATDSWTATSTTGAPVPRNFHTAVWTGSEMIVWGGTESNSAAANTGGRYNPVTNSWILTTTTGAPSARRNHTAVWTGSEMIVWGGSGSNTGGRYNPATNLWINTSTTGAPSARGSHTAIWTGSEMIVWGGSSDNTGGRYNPVTDFWTATTTTGAPSARGGHTAVWTSNEMIVWGGGSNTGGRYSQPAPPLSIFPTTVSFVTTGGTSNVNVIAQGGCTWTATSNANWLTIIAGGSGAGNGAVTYSVAANTLGPRTGILTIGTQSFIVRQAGVATPRVIRAGTAGGAPGSTDVSVPIEIVSQGDENALGFTLTFNPAVLGNPTVALGADAAGGQLSTNTNQVAQGRLGIALALAAGQKFTAGTRQVVVVTFSIAANAPAGMTPLDFDDLPSAREVSDVSANALPASYQGGSITIVSGFEADVAPRPQGNGSVTITDWVQIGRFAAGLDTAAAGVEFQRADCAPRSSFGDGRLSVADWTQAGRYATGADPITAAGGPTTQASQLSLASGDWSAAAGARSAAANRQASLVRARWQTTTDRLTIEMDARGDENALGFSLQFDPGEWSFGSAATGRDAAGAALHVNATQAARGRVGVVLALPAGQRLNAGARQIVIVQFAARGGRGAIEFSDYPVKREVVDAEANVTPSAFAAAFVIDRSRKQK